jgi:solute:Na+ symporter, SSS family
MNLYIFLPLLFGLQIFYWFIGRRFGKKKSMSKEDYFLAGKSIKFFPLMMTFLATLVGGGVILGAAEEAYHYGWQVILYPLGAVLGFILLGSGIGRKLAGFKVNTIAQIFEVVYGSPVLKRIASLLSIISLFMILVGQIIASHKFLMSLGFTNTLFFVAFWAIVILYTAQGGLRAVISTDLVQAAFFSLIFLFSFGFVLFSDGGSSFFQFANYEGFAKTPAKLSRWLLLPLFFMVIEQDIAQRCFAAASARVVSKASMVAGLCMMVVCIIPVFFGTVAKSIGLAVPPGESVLMLAVATLTNPWITALIGCAVLAAIISTATSLINAISSNLASDFNISILQNTKVIQAVTCIIAIASIFFAFFFDNIVDLLIQSYELSVCSLFIPIFMALFKRQGNFFSALFSMFFGMIGFFLFKIIPVAFPREILTIFLSLVGFGLGECIKQKKEVL